MEKMDVNGLLDTAQGISEYGIMAVICAAFLILSVVILWFVFRHYMKIVDKMVEGQKTQFEELLEETKAQNTYLSDISEGLKKETMARIRAFCDAIFDLNKEKVCQVIKKVRRENNIANEEATLRKVKRLLQNIHNERNDQFDNFKWGGRHLSYYTDPDWLAEVMGIVLAEVYDQDFNEDRMRTNVSTAYKDIKLKFYQRINEEKE